MRWIALSASGAVVAAGLVLCLQAGVTPAASQAQIPSGDAVKGKAVAQTRCAACHGVDGNPAAAQFPRLAGQFPEYIQKQLQAFKGEGDKPPKRLNPIMRPIAEGLTAADAADLAAYFAGQAPKFNAATADAGRLELGRSVYLEGDAAQDLPACVSCHRASGEGIRPDFPKIGGQSPVYLATQLSNWMKTRGHPGKLMSIIVPRLQPEERQAVVDYIGQLRPPPNDPGAH